MQSRSHDRIPFTLVCSLLLTVLTWLAMPANALAGTVQPLIATGGFFSFSGTPPTNLGIQQNQLAACPTTPNCVNSQSLDQVHQIEPLTYTTTTETAWSKLKTVIQSLPRTKIVKETDNYLYAEFTTPIMGFVDDVEFYLAPGTQTIQVRSASRLGESDLGVNRQRIETIRAKLQSLDAESAA